jgi:hypothetical protein
VDGTTEVIPNHLWTLAQTSQVVGQEANKWSSISLPSPHNTQPTLGPSNTTPLRTKFSLVGKRPRRACHEKTITLDGAQLPHTLTIIPKEFDPTNEGGRIFYIYKYMYKEATENWSPNLNDQESIAFVIGTNAIASTNSK